MKRFNKKQARKILAANPEYDWVAIDISNRIYVYKEKPRLIDGFWEGISSTYSSRYINTCNPHKKKIYSREQLFPKNDTLFNAVEDLNKAIKSLCKESVKEYERLEKYITAINNNELFRKKLDPEAKPVIIDEPEMHHEQIEQQEPKIQVKDMFEWVEGHRNYETNPVMLTYDRLVSLSDPESVWSGVDNLFGTIKRWIKDGSLKRLPKGSEYTVKQER